jgi:regulator of sigma E protease
MDVITQTASILFWFIIILVPLVAIHEFGHLLMSKLFGVKIPEYGIGLPLVKRTFFFRWKSITWSFYWPLLGGFVRIYGDNDAIDEAYETNKIDSNKAKQDYVQNRFQEIIATRDLQFFLEENGLEYEEKWKTFERSKFAKGAEVDSKKNPDIGEFKKLFEQVSTLIEWEFDKEIESKETFFSKNWIQQTLIISGGVIFNMITALVLFWSIFTIFSFNTSAPIDSFSEIQKDANISNQSEYLVASLISKDSTASEADIKAGDKIYSFAGVPANQISSQQDFRDIVQQNKGQEVVIEFESKERDQREAKTVNIKDGDGDVLFGVGALLREVTIKAKGPIAGVRMASNQTYQFTMQTFSILGDIVKAPFPGQDKEALNAVGGPIAVGAVGSDIFSSFGFTGILYVMAIVSISLAVFNILPIPALDGGRWIILTINKITGKRNRKIEGAVISITFLLLIGLAIIIAARDLQGVVTGRF